MPFTPFHMGPGLAIKACMGRSFSLTAFGYSQILMDIQPLYVMLGGDAELHGWTHTYLGSLLVGSAAFLTMRPVVTRLVNLLRASDRRDFESWGLLPETGTYTLGSVAAGSYIGSLSHVALDSIMHADMKPLLPFSAENSLQGILSFSQLHTGCIALAAIGIVVWQLKRWRKHAG